MSENRDIRSRRFAQLVGLELKAEFARHEISQGRVADSLGHSRGGYSKWINAKPSMPLEALLNTCEFIEIAPRQIVDAAYTRLVEEMGECDSDMLSESKNQFIDTLAADPTRFGVTANIDENKTLEAETPRD